MRARSLVKRQLENLVKTAELFPSLVMSTVIMPDKELTLEERSHRGEYSELFCKQKLNYATKEEFKESYQKLFIPQKNNVSEFSAIPNPDIRNNIIGTIVFIVLLYIYYLPLSYFHIL